MVGDRPMTPAERQAARRQRQNETEALFEAVMPHVDTMLGAIGKLRRAMMAGGVMGREPDVIDAWQRLVAAYGAIAGTVEIELPDWQIERDRQPLSEYEIKWLKRTKFPGPK
jgi:hypothetical protein